MLQNEVQEIQGLYGPFSLSERVLQKIWLRGDFDQTKLQTESGKSLVVVDPGRWNLLEGPDFLEARLKLDGEEIVVDVEVHFYASDWNLHGHSQNPNFSNVQLHVVLYPEDDSTVQVMTQKGKHPEALYLLPLLERDLEEYAIDDALLELEQVQDAEWMLRFLSKPLEVRHLILRHRALARWERKRNFAEKRLLGASWKDACHQYCLEVLGYSRNRAPMSQIALDYSIEDFAQGRVEVESVFKELKDKWKLSGLRPANHPKQRLQQYREICEQCPNWPIELREQIRSFEVSESADNGVSFRKSHSLSRKLESITVVFGNKISAKRLNTLVCDAILPLAAADGMIGASEYWLNWPAGDAPDSLHRFLKNAGVLDRQNPFSNGHLQGALQLLLEG